MKKHFVLFLAVSSVVAVATSCTTMRQVKFPPSNELFITTGDGDITKPLYAHRTTFLQETRL